MSMMQKTWIVSDKVKLLIFFVSLAFGTQFTDKKKLNHSMVPLIRRTKSAKEEVQTETAVKNQVQFS